MRDRVRRIFRNVNDGLDLIVFLNSTEPHIDRSFFYATGLTDGLFEGCGAWLTPDGGCEITTSAFERMRKLAPKSARFVDVSEAVVQARLVKDAEEIERIQRACDIASRSFEE